jgi:hypothetical protein
MHSNEEKLAVVLEMSGITPPAEDQEAILRAFSTGRELSKLIFSVPQARYEEPALIFSARV